MARKDASFFPSAGVGVGIRRDHFSVLRTGRPQSIDWGEALTENYLRWENGFLPRSFLTLQQIRENLPIALHGVGLSIGSADPLNQNYLVRLKELIDRISPLWVSDHLCWTGVGGKNSHDLLPIPFRKTFLDWIVTKIDQVQSFLHRPILIENVSSYVDFKQSEMEEWEFLVELARRTGCGLLLDINNVFVSGSNHGFDPLTYLSNIPPHYVGQIHLAGHLRKPRILIDTHSTFVCDEVWALYQAWRTTHGRQSVMIEWDIDVPEWDILESEVKKMRKIYEGKLPQRREALAGALL